MATTQEILNNLNITSNYKGYNLITEAVDIVLEDETTLDNVVEKVYNKVAEINNISKVSVERNIRTAIAHSWNVAPHRCNKVLDYKCEKPPHASLFIKLIVEKLKKDNRM